MARIDRIEGRQSVALMGKRAGCFPFLAAGLMILAVLMMTHAIRAQDVGADVALDRITRIFDTATGQELELGELVERLAAVDVAFLGETHLDESTHRFEHAVYEGLIRRTGGRVVLAMEMFERDVQGVLDDYLAGKITEGEFLRNSRPWNNYRTGYRPLIETARARHLPVVASNTPRQARARVAMGGGQEAYEKIVAEGKDWVPAKLFPENDEYWERMARSVRGHAYMIMGGSAEDRLYSGQSLWDNTMGYSCAQVVDRNPGAVILHVNGGFHSGHRLGTVEQLLLRRPETRVATVQIRTTSDMAAAGVDGKRDHDFADYVVYGEARARGLSEGTHAVMAAQELRYRLIVPHGVAASDRLPLLVWLPDDGIRAEDAETLWKDVLGDEAVVAVVEHLFPQLEEQLYRGGRWFWQETFDKDQSVLQASLERLTGYIARHFPVDPERIVIAGEGTGATVVSSMALFTALPVEMLAVAPRSFHKVRDLPLPDEAAGDGHLELLVTGENREWWEKEAGDREEVGLSVDLDVREGAALNRGGVETVREMLGLGLEQESAAAPTIVLVLFDDSPLAVSWARLISAAMTREGESAVVVSPDGLAPWLEPDSASPPAVRPLAFAHELDGWRVPAGARDLGAWSAADLQDGAALPLAPNPFGGATVLVVPGDLSQDQRQAWLALQEEDVIKKQSRFASLKVAFTRGERRLGDVLEEIKSGGRKVAHIVPAVFCAPAPLMRELRALAASYTESMQITFLPGLGGGLDARVGKREG